MQKNIRNYLIKDSDKISEALFKINKYGNRILFVTDKKNQYLGSLTDGDIRRSILKKIKLNELAPEIDKILNGNQQGRVVVKHGE